MNSFVDDQRNRVLESYRVCPSLLLEHYNIELNAMSDGHANKQIMELVQNGADAILESKAPSGKIQVKLDRKQLVVSNTGAPLNREGIKALMGSHRSTKKEGKIGRFGLGFKSLLHLGGRITILSRGGEDIQFDPEKCRDDLCREFGEKKVPSHRLAWLPAPGSVSEFDSNQGTHNPFTTVVCAEIINAEMYDKLEKEVKEFPSEMILFLVPEVQIDFLLGTDLFLKVKKARQGIITTLSTECVGRQESADWQIHLREANRIDDQALQDATLLHALEAAPIHWALPLGQRPRQDLFWAFFPTQTPSRVPGIINSFWKLNSGRDHLIEGPWNQALLAEAAVLVSETLPDLGTEEDPGKNIDYFPRKGDDKNWAADAMAAEIWNHLLQARVIPNAKKELSLPEMLLLPPFNDEAINKEWERLAHDQAKAKTVHHRCLVGQRKYRLDEIHRLSNGVALPRWDLGKWLCSARGVSLEEVRSSMLLYERIQKTDEIRRNLIFWGKSLKEIDIIPAENGDFINGNQAFLYTIESLPYDKKAVRKDVAEDPECRRILVECFGLTEPSGISEAWETSLEKILKQIRESPWNLSSNQAWEKLWAQLGQAPMETALAFIERHGSDLRILRADHLWVGGNDALKKGTLLKIEDNENQGLSISQEFFDKNKLLLDSFGIRETCKEEFESHSQATLDSEQRSVLNNWIASETRIYQAHTQHPGRPREDCIFIYPIALPAGSFLLAKAKGWLLCQLTRIIAETATNADAGNKISYVRHSSPDRYARLRATVSPSGYLLKQYGSWWIGGRAVRLSVLLVKWRQLETSKNFPVTEPTLRKILEWLEKNAGRDGDRVPSHENREFWHAMMTEAEKRPDSGISLEHVWELAAEDGVVPDLVRILGREVPFQDVRLTCSKSLARRAQDRGLHVVSPGPKAFAKWPESGCLTFKTTVQCENPSMESVPLIETIPGIHEYLRPSWSQNLARYVDKLRLVTDSSVEIEVACCLQGNVLLIDREKLRQNPHEELLEEMIETLACHEALTADVTLVCRDLLKKESQRRRAEIFRMEGLANKIALIFRDHPSLLLEAMGDLREYPFVREHAAQPKKIAELVLARHGIGTLAYLRPQLEVLKYEPPKRWGTAEARRWVSSLGFPDEYSVSTEMQRDAEESVLGPMPLPELHDFQRDVFGALHELWKCGQKRRRAVVSLPTGAGKTRVTVQAATELFLKEKARNRILLWVAQSDELCEQAVQAFRHVWRNLGSEQEDLRIVRFWGGHPNPGEFNPDRPVVVIATVQTLNARMGPNGANEWQKRVGLAVFDECHHAIAPSYTGVIRWLDVDSSPGASGGTAEPMILGLSATPFRSDEAETNRLARRFDRRWFPSNQDELFKRLRSNRILAEPIFEKLETGIAVDFSADDLQILLANGESSFEVERILEKTNQVLATNEKRNLQIIDLIRKANEHSILLFANSVRHAEELSARLTLEGIPAAAVCGETPRSVRRDFIQRFVRCELRVLVNHSIFYAGFDAPKTEMIIITRLVQSPVRYMQMVGRGLRGPKNGGTEQCRIVTLLDNLREFSDRHPYHYCAGHYS